MKEFAFEIDYWALLIVLALLPIGYFLWKKKQSYADPTLFFSSLSQMINPRKGRLKWRRTCDVLNGLGLLLFILAFLDPHFFVPKKRTETEDNKKGIPTEGIAIYLLLDQSGSMGEDVVATINGKRENISKEDLLKRVTREFIVGNPQEGLEGRPDDLIGLVTFARVPQILSPLTLDHQEILKQLAHIQVIKNREDDGTAMGYAIFKTVNMIAATQHYAAELAQKGKPSYAIKNSIIILVTDGLQDPSLLDKESRLRNMGLEEAAQAAKDNGIRLYLINIDPHTFSEELTPQRNQMERITQLTGGRLFIVNDPGDISQIYADINQIEKSSLPQQGLSKKDQPYLYQRISFYPYLISLGLLSMLLSVFLKTTLWRKAP